MTNHPLYKQLRRYVLDGDMTAQQVQGMTKHDVAKLLGVGENDPFWSNGNEGFWINLKGNLVQELHRRNNEQIKQTVSAMIDVPAFCQQFPNLELDHGELGGKRYITVWLDGKPEVHDGDY